MFARCVLLMDTLETSPLSLGLIHFLLDDVFRYSFKKTLAINDFVCGLKSLLYALKAFAY